ncbi:uncharacterized protein LOC105190442 [Harpegnathos saltator]|uniref:Chondroadherin n=1 Tax=Harpegnathos saltator TaxID=610380 RepID=E2C657_HARSA|nr:uncharacterized protein LOC105190442 [Harpegnathos saltator]EFN76577.1 Chondroadherin [Harpegnathos saltator]
MDSALVLALIAFLTAYIGNVAASCREVPNDDMLEYLCEGGHPSDLAAMPETTEKLRISRMPLRRITADTFSKFGHNLWVLSCSYCEISDIEANAFRRLVNLQQLSLNNNHLTAVKASWFEGLDSLTYLDVNYNDIHDIEDGVYQNLPALVDFRISGNRLRCLNLDGMTRLRQLKRMFLSENPEFACPYAISEFLEKQRVTFERDPEWRRLAHDRVEIHVPPSHTEEEEEQDSQQISVPTHRERPQPDWRLPQQPGAPFVPPSAGNRTFHPAQHYGRRRKPTTTTTTSTTMRPFMQSHIPRVEPIPPPGGARTSYQVPEQSRPAVFYPYPRMDTPWAPLLESKPPLEDTKITTGADRPPPAEDVSTYPSYVPGTFSHEITSLHPSYVTSERPRAPSMDSGPSSEDVQLTATTGKSPAAEHTLTYPVYVPTYDTSSNPPSYTTSERSRVLLVEPRLTSEDTTGSTVRPDRPLLTEHTLTYPPYAPTNELVTYPYPPVTTQRTELPIAASATSPENEMTWSDESSHIVEDTVSYPLYTATSNGQEMTPHGSMQLTRSWSTNGPDATSRTWSTDDSMEYRPDDSREDGERHREWSSLLPTDRQETPYHVSPTQRAYTSDRRVIVDDRWSSSTDDFFIATDLPVEHDEVEHSSTTMTTSSDVAQDVVNKTDMHYVMPMPASQQPELMHPVSTGEFYQAPYYESTVTMHPPSLNYQEHDDDEEPTTVMEMTTDKPLPDCPPKSSSPRVRPASVLVMSIVVVIFGHVIVTEF